MTLRQGVCGLCLRLTPVVTVLVFDPHLVRTAADFASVCLDCRPSVDAIVADMLASNPALRVHICHVEPSKWVAA